jgi:hypothetical protein
MADKNLEISFANISASSAVVNKVTNVTSTPVIATATPVSVSAISPSNDININILGVNFGYPAVMGLYKRNDSSIITNSYILRSIGRPRSSTYLVNSSILKNTGKLIGSSTFISSLNLKTVSINKSSPAILVSTPLKFFERGTISISVLSISNNTKTPGLNKFSNINATSNILNYQVVKAIQDFVYPTDDVYGEANIDDDQTASVDKALLSSIGAISFRILNTSKTLPNSQVLSLSNNLKTTNITKTSAYLSNSVRILSVSNIVQASVLSNSFNIKTTSKTLSSSYVPQDLAFSVAQSYFEDLTYLEVNTYVGVTTILT